MPNTKTVGYAGRVVPWKGLKEVAEACFELGLNLKLMGKFDKPDYWNSIEPEVQANIDLEFLDCDDYERPEFYKQLDVFVNFSGPGRETGTLPLMEAMASGVPVITTTSGIATDICEDHENSVVVPFGNKIELKNNLLALIENSELKEKIRRNAWNSIKNFTEAQRAWEYEKLYHQVYSDDPLVSVIIPATYDRKRLVVKILAALNANDYKHIEAVVVFDQELPADVHEELKDFKFYYPIKFISTGKDNGYNLAMGRNMAAIESQGKYLLFCDSRMKPDAAAISIFMDRMEKMGDSAKKSWLYGNKGTGKRTFVENFSFIRRDSFIRAGMFNERIDRYGGMSQEVRQRFLSQGFEMTLVEDAIAEQMSGSHLSEKRR